MKKKTFTYLKDGNSVNIIKNVLQLVYLENTGAAWGILSGKMVFFIVLTAIMIIVIAYVFIKTPGMKKYEPLRWCLTALMAGAIGNMIDRIANGYVKDFIYFKIIDFPVFNFADICVTLSMIILILLVIFKYKDHDFKFLSFKKNKDESVDSDGKVNADDDK